MPIHGWKIGEIAERTGMSVPSLRHYDSVGLVSPSHRSPGRFRLYGEDDMRKILLVRRMKPLGFSLEEMRGFLQSVESLDSSDFAHQAAGKEFLARLRSEAQGRYEKLTTQVRYAEEFLDILAGFEPEPGKE